MLSSPSATPTDVSSREQAHAALRVLVVGPLMGEGGLARVARQSAEGFDAHRISISACDTTKDTANDRSTLAAIGSHLRREGRLVAALRRHRPHIAHLHTCSYGTYFRTLIDAATCRAMGVPYVLHIHGGLFAEFLDGLRGTRRRLALVGLRQAAAVVVLSPNWRTRLMQEVGGLNCCVIANALESFRPYDVAFPRDGGILFVGDLSETKRCEDLLVAYAALPADMQRRYGLSIIGGGSTVRARLLAELARRLNVEQHVRFCGPLKHAEVQAALARADLFVLPSRAEGMPLALMEAMAAGVPIVATRVGAIPEMLAEGHEGVLVAPNDTQALAAALRTLLGDARLRSSLGDAARRRALASFNSRAFHAGLLTLWRQVAATPAAADAPVPRLAASSHFLR